MSRPYSHTDVTQEINTLDVVTCKAVSMLFKRGIRLIYFLWSLYLLIFHFLGPSQQASIQIPYHYEELLTDYCQLTTEELCIGNITMQRKFRHVSFNVVFAIHLIVVKYVNSVKNLTLNPMIHVEMPQAVKVHNIWLNPP